MTKPRLVKQNQTEALLTKQRPALLYVDKTSKILIIKWQIATLTTIKKEMFAVVTQTSN